MNIFHSKTRFISVFMVFILGFNYLTKANNDFLTCEIKIKSKSINIGEPLAIELIYHLKKPFISGKTNEIVKEIENSLTFKIEENELDISKNFLIYPFKLVLQDEAGLEYKGTFIVWYDYQAKKLFLDKPGEYSIQMCSLKDEIFSNTITINVTSKSNKAQEALYILKEPDDYLFLVHGLNEYSEKREERIERLKKVQQKSKKTILEQWSAARLGVEYFNDIQYSTERDHSKVNEIQSFLNTGIDLPDEFPIREETLYRLSTVESMKGNNERAVALLDELIEKYPKGRFVEEAKKSRPILAQRKNLTEINNQTTTSINSLKIIALLGLSFLVVVTIILIGKKKGIKF